MLDVSLLKDPVFMLIGVSNIFGMAGLYVPFVYLVEAAKAEVIIFSTFGGILARELRYKCETHRDDAVDLSCRNH